MTVSEYFRTAFPEASFEEGRIVWENPRRAAPRYFWDFDVFQFAETADRVMGEVLDNSRRFPMDKDHHFLVEIRDDSHYWLWTPDFALSGAFMALLQAMLRERLAASLGERR